MSNIPLLDGRLPSASFLPNLKQRYPLKGVPVIKRLPFWFAVYAITLLISSCATTPRGPGTSDVSSTTPSDFSAKPWSERKLALSRINNWNISGKIAIKTPNDSGSAFVTWQERHPHYDISLSGALGVGAMQLTGGPGKVVLQANGKTVTASNTGQLLAQQTGWHLPVENLYYWIRGLPAPGAASNTQFDKQNRLLTLSQQGWQIQYLNYKKVGNVELPGRMALDSADFHAKIAIQQWGI